ncbi:unnamed protein product [Protopolystoma xenopodis]|uniref:Uncharacterized protein n=1 Tax=Protopolystoma xenopodis TaxID=117903 RepID=A0A448WRH7_9PLAT|nr:unnamed protein product [Protopolystoma xenopodis]
MLPLSDDVRHMTSVSMNLQVKPINSWSREIRLRLRMEATFESLDPTLSLEMEVSSIIMKQENLRNPTFLRISYKAYCQTTSSHRRRVYPVFISDANVVVLLTLTRFNVEPQRL